MMIAASMRNPVFLPGLIRPLMTISRFASAAEIRAASLLDAVADDGHAATAASVRLNDLQQTILRSRRNAYKTIESSYPEWKLRSADEARDGLREASETQVQAEIACYPFQSAMCWRCSCDVAEVAEAERSALLQPARSQRSMPYTERLGNVGADAAAAYADTRVQSTGSPMMKMRQGGGSSNTDASHTVEHVPNQLPDSSLVVLKQTSSRMGTRPTESQGDIGASSFGIFDTLSHTLEQPTETTPPILDSLVVPPSINALATTPPVVTPPHTGIGTAGFNRQDDQQPQGMVNAAAVRRSVEDDAMLPVGGSLSANTDVDIRPIPPVVQNTSTVRMSSSSLSFSASSEPTFSSPHATDKRPTSQSGLDSSPPPCATDKRPTGQGSLAHLDDSCEDGGGLHALAQKLSSPARATESALSPKRIPKTPTAMSTHVPSFHDTYSRGPVALELTENALDLIAPSASRTPSPLQRQRYFVGQPASAVRGTTFLAASSGGGGGGGCGDNDVDIDVDDDNGGGGRDRGCSFDRGDSNSVESLSTAEFGASIHVSAPRLINSRAPPPSDIRFGREDTHDAVAAGNSVETVSETAGASMAVADTDRSRAERGVSSAAQLLRAAISVTDASGRDVHVHEDSSAYHSDESSIADSFASLADDVPNHTIVTVSPPSPHHPHVVSSSVSGHQPVTVGARSNSGVGASPTDREGVNSAPASNDVRTRTLGSVPLITSTTSGPNYLDYVPNFEAMRGKRPSIVSNIMGSPATPGAHYGSINDNESDSSFSDS